MKTDLVDTIKQTTEGQRADEILRRCVHCGFCNATCPTYQLLGDENDETDHGNDNRSDNSNGSSGSHRCHRVC